MPTFHDFSAETGEGGQQSLALYAGKVVLVVNTASECGYTRQYAGLQELQQHFSLSPFSVLAFPCNQFGAQEPGSHADIVSFCQTRFAVTFPVMAKCEVNGPGASPLWQWLTGAAGDYPQPVKWNFTKFLIDPQGRLVKRFEPAVEPYELVEDIHRLLRRP
ncbi:MULTISPECIES: glutathione peroxidase [unclassified Paludibacterium]|uniref:glutathione peroxidase n=1 Tax=unclassified Paludibacterium TaxID=2618429 RepID=UPI001C04362E|nr:glutathione peroxidase [Paludibacterium sp. B53371]BEV73384.1 glutathione peroxidase [Paludibacterium sp. THUN1379]